MKLHRLEIELDTDSNTYTGSVMVEGERLIEVHLNEEDIRDVVNSARFSIADIIKCRPDWDTTFIPAKSENEGA